MSSIHLPSELWTQIFDLAVDEQTLFNVSFPNALIKCSWFKTVLGDWTLNTPTESLHSLLRRSYATKKAITLTCRAWRVIGSEFLFRSLFFDHPVKLRQLCAVLDRNSSLGWWTKRLHITRYYAGNGFTLNELEDSLISIVRNCPNLEIFVVNWPMTVTFAPIADALCTYRPSPASLRSVSWNVPFEALAKVIWALDSLPGLESVLIDISAPQKETILLGAASDVSLSLPNLRELSLLGSSQEFLEQASGWEMPRLASLTINLLSNTHDLPDIVDFLTHHGASLSYLDIDCIPALDVSAILSLCPILTAFMFNADWHVPGAPAPPGLSHSNITHIGCHGLLYAFGVGYAETVAEESFISAAAIRRTNDLNFSALTRVNFPRLQCVRVLNQGLLRDLNAANGPSKECYGRWERWWDQCASQNIRLEDCCGNPLGTLPDDPPSDDEDVDDDSESDEEETEEEEQNDPYNLRQLLEECRQMTAERDEPLFQMAQFALPQLPS